MPNRVLGIVPPEAVTFAAHNFLQYFLLTRAKEHSPCRRTALGTVTYLTSHN